MALGINVVEDVFLFKNLRNNVLLPRVMLRAGLVVFLFCKEIGRNYQGACLCIISKPNILDEIYVHVLPNSSYCTTASLTGSYSWCLVLG